MLVGGALIDTPQSIEVVNPATEELAGRCACGEPAHVDTAVAAARAAFPAWADTPIDDRRRVLHAIADVAERHVAEIATILVAEQGKPLAAARGEVERVAGAFRHVAHFDLPEHALTALDSGDVEVRRRPLGVVAAIVPWNFPLILMAAKVPYALLAGNTVVLKPAPTTPLATLRLFELAREVIPPGVVNTLADPGDLGPALTTHPDVAKISFTGSTATGRRVMAGAADTLKRLTLELGGNDAAIVLDDADVGAIAPRLFEAAFRNSGQLCAAVKRLYVHESVHDALCARLVELADAAVVGNGAVAGTTMGPLQNRTQFDRVLALIETARDEGRLLTGGGVPGRGYFIRPAIVSDMPDDSTLVAEEQFGPILPVLRFTDEDDAIQRANASPYGLGGSIWTSDMARGHALATRLDCGTVWINKHAEMSHDIPFAGAKQSGFGVEMGPAGLEEFTRIQVINAAGAGG